MYNKNRLKSYIMKKQTPKFAVGSGRPIDLVKINGILTPVYLD